MLATYLSWAGGLLLFFLTGSSWENAGYLDSWSGQLAFYAFLVGVGSLPAALVAGLCLLPAALMLRLRMVLLPFLNILFGVFALVLAAGVFTAGEVVPAILMFWPLAFAGLLIAELIYCVLRARNGDRS